MKNAKSTLSILVLSALASLAGAAVQEPAETAASCQLKVATGKHGKGYSKLFADIQSVCGSQVQMCEVETEGGLDNLTSLSSNQADLGFVQLDTLASMKDSDASIGALQAVLSLNANLLHIVARANGYNYEGFKRLVGMLPGETTNKTVTKLSDLMGRSVAVVGSAQKLGRTVNRDHRLEMSVIDVATDEQALTMLKAGQVDAVFSTSGWPNGPIAKLKRESGLILVNFDHAGPSEKTVKKNYANLGAYDVPFLTAPNLLVTRPFSAKGPNGKNVAALQACILKNLSALQEGRFEPGWQEVKTPTDTAGWTRFVGAQKR
jgi:TRAP-type uncharacterized transport system substrate-binding protein